MHSQLKEEQRRVEALESAQFYLNMIKRCNLSEVGEEFAMKRVLKNLMIGSHVGRIGV